MRLGALLTIVVCEILITAVLILKMSADTLILISTLVVALSAIFSASALLGNFKSLRLRRNYLISGIVGVILALLYYLWASENLDAVIDWLQNSGIYLLMALIFLLALLLYFTPPKSKKAKNQSGIKSKETET